MKVIRSGLVVLAVLVALGQAARVQGAGFVDPLDTPAQMSPLAAGSLLQGVARAGNWLVAVGQRGHILVSTDGGVTWKQSQVPVSSDLTAVFFASDRKGWAVGHDGVILNTLDGGVTWTLQLDGMRANERLVESLQHEVKPGPDAAERARLLDEAKRYKELGADKPFLDVWFADENKGFAVGAYNLIFHTTDGGKNWEPWFDRTENPKLFNLYAIHPAAGGLYIAGEGGLVLKLEPDAQRFRALPVAYKGSFFGVVGSKSTVLVFGLRGNAFRSDDGGKTWVKVDVGLPASIVGGTTTGDGALLLGDQGGRVVVSQDGGLSFKPAPLKNPMPLAGLADAGNGRLALVGPRGVAVAELGAR
jgi:photosystem II stability/assembly factor-like uncharacterized protein